MQKLTHALTAALLAVAAVAFAQPVADQAAALERGRELTRAFYAGELAPIAQALSAELAEAVGGEAGLRAFRDQVTQQLGNEIQLLDEQVHEVTGAMVYARTARFEGYGGPVLVNWAVDRAGTVVGFQVQPAPATEPAPSRYLDHETRADLRLPLAGQWAVFWGGRSVEQNYHAAYRDQRFAYDFVVVQGGSTHSGDGRRNSDYHCFEQPVLAPGAGVVVAAVGALPDNVPGELDDAHPLGNHVIIDHGTGEFSFLAHLRQGTVTVEAGQRVEAGEPIGECGNSGRSSEPHLHYHLQDGPEFGAGEGLPAQFQGYLADGELVARGEPLQGQFVANVEGE